MLNKSKGNMYPFVTHTWNVIKGKCVHDCSYCYMKFFPQKDLWFDKKELKTDLGNRNFIFIGSSTDMWADNIPIEWLNDILHYIRQFNNTYLFQSKNPCRFKEIFRYPDTDNIIYGTTIETNRQDLINEISNAPSIEERVSAMENISDRKMLTIEPIMDFDVNVLIEMIKRINPLWVNVGADSKGHELPEPSTEKIQELISKLKIFTDVKLKSNLKRLTEGCPK